jgi:hypothetical protein
VVDALPKTIANGKERRGQRFENDSISGHKQNEHRMDFQTLLPSAQELASRNLTDLVRNHKGMMRIESRNRFWVEPVAAM